MSDAQDSMDAALYWQSEEIKTLRAALAAMTTRAEKAEAMAREFEESFDHAAMDAKNAKDALAAMTASRDRLRTLELARIRLGRAQLTRDARMKQEAREVIKAAFAAVDAAGDLGGAA